MVKRVSLDLMLDKRGCLFLLEGMPHAKHTDEKALAHPSVQIRKKLLELSLQ